MNLFRLFGMGEAAIMAKNHSVQGTVSQVYRCWWLTVNTKPFRRYSGDGALYPYIITFSYTVDSVPYQGKRYIPVRYRVPQKGETIDVFYDPDDPAKYACYAFGPGSSL